MIVMLGDIKRAIQSEHEQIAADSKKSRLYHEPNQWIKDDENKILMCKTCSILKFVQTSTYLLNSIKRNNNKRKKDFGVLDLNSVKTK